MEVPQQLLVSSGKRRIVAAMAVERCELTERQEFMGTTNRPRESKWPKLLPWTSRGGRLGNTWSIKWAMFPASFICEPTSRKAFESMRNIVATSIVALVFLTGCNVELAADLHSSDLRSTAAGHETLAIPATLRLPVKSLETCRQETRKIVNVVKGIVEPFEPKGCESRDLDLFLLADTRIPLRKSVAEWERTGKLFGIVSRHDESGGEHIDVFVTMNQPKFETLSKRAKREYFWSLDLNTSEISVMFNNDERDDVTIRIDHAFVEGAPVLDALHAVPRRGQVVIVLSNVSVAYLGRNGTSPVFELMN